MRTSNIIVFMLLFGIHHSVAQQNPHLGGETHDAWVSLFDRGAEVQGILYEAKDSSIVLMRFSEDQPLDFELAEFSVSNIYRIRTRKATKKPVMGTLMGAGIGFVVGALIGGAAPRENEGGYMDFGRGGGAVAGGILVGALGAGFGYAVSSSMVTIPINGSLENYRRNKGQLNEYARKKFPE